MILMDQESYQIQQKYITSMILARPPRHSHKQYSNDANLIHNPLITCYGFIATTLKLLPKIPSTTFYRKHS